MDGDNRKALVSIIVPIYNVEQYLKQCMDSIRSQTMRDIEIILVDDGSPDDCPRMCDAFAAEDHRVSVYHQSNKGASAARNLGIKMAKADWLMFADPDDWLEPNAVEVLYERAKASGCDIVYASCYLNYATRQEAVSLDGGEVGKHMVKQGLEFLLDYLTRDRKSKINAMVPPWGKIYRRSIIAGHTDCRFPVGMKQEEDYIFNLYVLQKAESVYFLDVPVYHYRMRPNSAAHAVLHDQQEQNRRFTDEIYTYMKKYRLLDQFLPYYYSACLHHIFGRARQYGRGVRSVRDFRIAASQLKTLCEGEGSAEAIANTELEFMLKKKLKAALWLLKHRLYAWVILLCYGKSRLCPEKL